MATSQQRKCSVCRKPGHDKRTCPDLRTPSSSRTKPHVRVHVVHDSTISDHIVDLGAEKKKQTDWHKITAYKEEARPRTKRVTVNFASLIKAHQQEQEVSQEHKTIAVAQPAQRRARPHRPRIGVTMRNPFAGIVSNMQESLSLFGQRITDRLTIHRFAAVGLVLCLVAMIPFPALSYYQKVQDDSRLLVARSTDAFMALQASTIAALNADLSQAQHDLTIALSAFSEAQGVVGEDHKTLFLVAELLPVIGTHVSSRTRLLQAGQHLALANTYLVKGIAASSDDSVLTPTERLRTLRVHIASALPQYQAALEELSGVNPRVIPSEYQEVFEEFKLLYATFVNDLGDTVGLIDAIGGMLGEEGTKRYLIVGQNSHELRPTGGFMGSFAIVEVEQGKIADIVVPGGGTYDVQGQLKAEVKPPLPLQVVNKRWEFQDANWFPDFSETGKKIAWFYEDAWGQPVDGVVAVNASVLERLLTVIGSVTTDTGVTLATDDVLSTLRSEIESANDAGSTAPKAILSDALDAVMAGLTDVDTFALIRLLSELNEALDQKEIQVYVENPQLQKTMASFGWTGEIADIQSAQDYLMVVSANIGGGKSDARVTQQVQHQVYVDPVTGDITDTVIIDRTHTGTEEELFYGAANVSYLRVYVPEGSVLVDAGGFTFPPEEAFTVPEPWYEDDPDLVRIEQEVGYHSETGTRITQEYGKTAFGNWMAVAPGETTRAYVVYTLPFKAVDSTVIQASAENTEKWKQLLLPEQSAVSRYSLVLQKQSGITSPISTTVIYPEVWHPAWSSRSDITMAQNGISYESSGTTDDVIGVVMQKETYN